MAGRPRPVLPVWMVGLPWPAAIDPDSAMLAPCSLPPRMHLSVRRIVMVRNGRVVTFFSGLFASDPANLCPTQYSLGPAPQRLAETVEIQARSVLSGGSCFGHQSDPRLLPRPPPGPPMLSEWCAT